MSEPQRPRVTFKASPEDFIVEEIDGYPALGEGSHTYVRIRKRGLTTDQALRRLATALGVDARACGYAGMKDREAVTTQRVSVPDVDPARILALGDALGDGTGRGETLEVLEVTRHRNKLKPGHLRGNRFVIVLRDLSPEVIDDVVARFEAIGRDGAPNAFGPQRFGRDGDNAARAVAFVVGKERPPRDARERRLLFSALQSRWFNRVLERRVAEGTFATPCAGDLLQKHGSGGLFVCADVDVDRPRATAFEISPTGPIFGAKMPAPGEPIAAREREVLADDGVTDEHLIANRALGEGTRRSLRLHVEEMACERVGAGVLRVTMMLPPGGYATTVLGCVVELVQPQRPRTDAVATATTYVTSDVASESQSNEATEGSTDLPHE